MIILLKIILSLFFIVALIVFRVMIKDYLLTIKDENFQNASTFDQLKIKIIFYTLSIFIISFAFLMGFYIFIPMGIVR